VVQTLVQPLDQVGARDNLRSGGGGTPPTPRAIGGSFLEFVPSGSTEVVMVVLHIEILNMPDRIALLSATPFHHRQ
jgi:hypothetical protein